MTVSLALFYVYALAAVAGAVGLVIARSLVHAVMWLFLTLVSVAALFLLMGSQFLAAMQLFVYGGAITVLVLFVLMVAPPSAESVGRRSPITRWIAIGTSAVFFGMLVFAMGATRYETSAPAQPDTAALAELLFSRYMLPFEVAGLLLTIALVGSIVLARGDDASQDDCTVVDRAGIVPSTEAVETP